eukprot:1159965-Pelagomonas_calceolata.AAC.20
MSLTNRASVFVALLLNSSELPHHFVAVTYMPLLLECCSVEGCCLGRVDGSTGHEMSFFFAKHDPLHTSFSQGQVKISMGSKLKHGNV